MSYLYEPDDFISPSDENPWILDAAKKWIYENKSDTGEQDIGINLIEWSKNNPESAFSVLQTILKLTEEDSDLFNLVGAGPLESFLTLCPNKFIELVFQVAQIDPRLRRAFKNVWQGSMTNERFIEIQRYSKIP